MQPQSQPLSRQHPHTPPLHRSAGEVGDAVREGDLALVGPGDLEARAQSEEHDDVQHVVVA